MRKLKVFLTVIVLYEFVILTVLQIHSYCVSIFNNNFCAPGFFKYFLLCFMVPALTGVFSWWLPEIGRMCCPNKCKCAPPEKEQNVLSKRDIEKFITAAIITGVQKFATKHPKTKNIFDNVLDIVKHTDTTKKKK